MRTSVRSLPTPPPPVVVVGVARVKLRGRESSRECATSSVSSRPLSSYSAKDNGREKKEEEMGVNGVNLVPATSLTDTHHRANLPCPPLPRLPRPRLRRQRRTDAWRSCSCPGPRDARCLEIVCRKAPPPPPATPLIIGQVDVARTLLLLSSEISLTASVTPSTPVETRRTQAVQATVTEDAPVDSIWWDYLCLRRYRYFLQLINRSVFFDLVIYHSVLLNYL